MANRNRVLLSILTVAALFCLTSCLVEQKEVTQQSLVLDQNEGYMAISENNTDGYDRSLFFYFYLKTNKTYEEQEVENILKDEILKVTLISTDESEFYSTTKLVWTVAKVEQKKFNLLLVLFPEIDDLHLAGPEIITRIEFLAKNGRLGYDLEPYIIEEKPTIPQNGKEKLYTSSVAVDTLMAEDMTAMYPMTIAGVGDICENEIFSLYWSGGLSSLPSSYIIEDVNDVELGREYQIKLFFTENAHQVIFRPFVQLTCGEVNYLLVPTAPAYIRSR